MEEDDQFGLLINRCQMTRSQEVVLRTCPLARESEVFPDDEEPESPTWTPVESTGIVMVSLPESSSNEGSRHEEFQTPPEDSLPVSIGEQGPPAVDSGAVPQMDGVGNGDTATVDQGCSDAERAVDLCKDSDNLGFSGEKLTQVVVSGGVLVVDGSHGVVTTEASEIESEKFIVLPRKSSLVRDDCSFESAPKKLKFSIKYLGSSKSPGGQCGADERATTETNPKRNTSTEVTDPEVEKIGGGLGKHQTFVNLPLRETKKSVARNKCKKVHKNGGAGSSRKNIKDLDKLKHVSSNGEGFGEDQMYVNLPLGETKKSVACNKEKEVHKSCSAGSSRKNIKDHDKLKHVCSNREGLGEDQMYVNLPQGETKKSVACNKGKEVHKSGSAGSSRKNIKDLDKLKHVSLDGEGLGEVQTHGDLNPAENEIVLALLALHRDDKVHRNGSEGSAWKKKEDLDRFRYVSSSGDKNQSKKVRATAVGERRELPPSITGQAKNAGGGGCELPPSTTGQAKNAGGGGCELPPSTTGQAKNAGGECELPPSITGQAKNAGGEPNPASLEPRNQIMKDLLGALRMVSGEVNDASEDVDIFETAQRGCMTFPRPRWWPVEGYK